MASAAPHSTASICRMSASDAGSTLAASSATSRTEWGRGLGRCHRELAVGRLDRSSAAVSSIDPQLCAQRKDQCNERRLPLYRRMLGTAGRTAADRDLPTGHIRSRGNRIGSSLTRAA
jgi:hypothetical protein